MHYVWQCAYFFTEGSTGFCTAVESIFSAGAADFVIFESDGAADSTTGVGVSAVGAAVVVSVVFSVSSLQLLSVKTLKQAKTIKVNKTFFEIIFLIRYYFLRYNNREHF
jgi:hypothetical protein